jgi:chromosome partitioning protein
MGLPPEQAVIAARPGLDVISADETIAAAELYLAGRRQRHQVLASRLAPALDAYDHVIVDCSPSLSLMNQNALVLAGSVLCPVACDYLSLVGVRQVLRTIQQVNRLLGHALQLWGVLPTQFDARARICHEALGTLRGHFGPRCLSPVRASIKVKEAPSVGQTLLEYAPGCTAALDYLEAVSRILDDVGCATAAASRLTAAGGEG